MNIERTWRVILGLLLLAAPVAVQGQSGSGSGYIYSINASNSSTITITNYTGAAVNVSIPSTINTLTVTGIGDGVDDVFGATAVTNVTIPGSVTTINASAFNNCSSLISVTIPASVTSIGGFAFDDCSSLTGVTIPNNVTSIGQFAFSGCLSLANVTIGSGVTSIGQYAFQECGLSTVTIPASATNIGQAVFNACSGLTAINVNPSNPDYISDTGVLLNYNQTTLIEYPEGNAATSYAISNSVTSIANDAFADCTHLTNITFTNNVTSIGQDAFEASGLASIIIPSSVTNIGLDAFYACVHLSAITVNSNNPDYSSAAGVLFDKNQTVLITYPSSKAGTSYTIPNSVTLIEDIAFYDCGNLTGVALSTNVTSIGNEAFAFCTGLTNITIPNSVTSIGQSAFYDCTSLTSVTIGSGVTSIQDYAFGSDANLSSVFFEGNAPTADSTVFTGDINATVYYLPGYNDWSNSLGGAPAVVLYTTTTNTGGLTITGYNGPSGAVTIPNSIDGTNVTVIGDGSDSIFPNYNVTSVTMGNNVTNIADNAFYDNGSLTSATIGNGVTSIGELAFVYSGLTNITIPGSVASIGDQAFEDCYYLTSATISNGVADIDSYAFAYTALTNLTIPGSVTSIGDQAFAYSLLGNVTIPASVTNLGQVVFTGCANQTAINVDPGNPDYGSTNGVLFDKNQFNLLEFPSGLGGCYTVPGTVTNIADSAFYGCALINVTIPGSVFRIGEDTFENCGNLTNATIDFGVTRIGESAFNGCSALLSVTIPGSVTCIGNSAFYQCVNLLNVTIPDSVTKIDPYAFYNCVSLTNITIPGSVTCIGSYAFEDCYNLYTATIGSGVTNIGSFAFADCESLTSLYFQGNAPVADGTVFTNGEDGDINATAYYLPGTTGWSAFSANTGLPISQEWVFTAIDSFSVFPNGANPQASLVQGSDGNFYGTTQNGGLSEDHGTVFKVTTNGTLTTLYSFTYNTTEPDGAAPAGALVQSSDGCFYGTTLYGGANYDGTVFKITTNGTLITLVDFNYSVNGAYPSAGLVQGTDGNFYGTTPNGGGTNNSHGTVFKMTPNGTLTNLYVFTNGVDGSEPHAPLVQDSNGNLYGTTIYGGASNWGTVFMITTNGAFTNLFAFTNYYIDGAYPYGGLAQGSDGDLYGTTQDGGNTNNSVYGNGTIFKITTNGVFSNLFSFTNYFITGAYPNAALVQGSDGNFYGTAAYGGTNSNGTIFQFKTNGTLNILYSLSNGIDGAYLNASLVQGSNGLLYGTAVNGGTSSGNGTVFSISTNGTFAALYAFPGVNNGQSAAALLHGSDGIFYGTTQNGGANGGNGTVYQITTNGPISTLLTFFNSDNSGYNPNAALAQGNDGNFYGTTSDGGTNDYGAIYQITPAGMVTGLYSFTNGFDGYQPNNALVLGSDGDFYGTTEYGGDTNNNSSGSGTIFKITTDGVFTALYSFTNGIDGSDPSGLVMGNDGNFYGTTEHGGTSGNGAFFVVSCSGGLSVLYSFTGGSDGGGPVSALALGNDGNFYGSTTYGGNEDTYDGTLFKMTPNGSLTTLYTFEGGYDGYGPSALLAGADGNFYGTTPGGGTNYEGSIFEWGCSVGFQTLYSFTGTNDGGSPLTALVQGNDGSVFGTTSTGGAGNYGGVFRLAGGTLPSPLPVITTQPVRPPSTLDGLSASFSVEAKGGAPLSYQWQQNGANVSQGDGVFGADLPNLDLDPVSLGEAGTYMVVVSNSYGVTTSSCAVLSVYPATTAQEDFEAATNYMDFRDFIEANLSFYNAVNLCPNNEKYNFFYAMTGLLALPQEPAGSNFLDRLDISAFGRDLLDWRAKSMDHSHGHWSVPVDSPPLNADEFTAQLRTNVLPAIITAESSLAQITNKSFTVCLTTNETHLSSVTVDWGDVQMLRAMGHAAELFIYTTHSWNLDVRLCTATNLLGPDGSIETFLTNFPNFMATCSTSDLPAAKCAFSNAICNYFAASKFIRCRPQDEIRLFNLDTTRTNEEQEFRQTLTNLLCSLNGPVALTTSPNNSVSAQAFFSGNFNPRSYFPQFQGNGMLWDSFPDVTFGGIITGLNENNVSRSALKHIPGAVETPATPIITWANPASIIYGTALPGSQLNATASVDGTNVPGTFTYNPPANTVLNAGTNTLSVTFNPTDSTDYNSAVAYATIVVSNAPLTVTASNAFWGPGRPFPTLTGTITGLVAGDNITAAFGSTASNGSAPGVYAIVPTLVDPNNRHTNYTVNLIAGTLTIEGIVVSAPTNGASFVNNQSFAFNATAYSINGIKTFAFYNNSVLVTSVSTSNINATLNDLPSGSYILSAVLTDNSNLVSSSAVYVTVNTPGTSWIDFDPLTGSVSGPVTNTVLTAYLAQYGVSVTNNSPATTVAVENQANVAGGNSVIASSLPNLLTQIGSNGPVSFTLGFAAPLAQFSFTRPELLANPSVSHPAWQVQAFDSLGVLLAATNAPQIASSTNVPAQTYTLTAGGIASVEFNSGGSGLTTFNAMLLDDLILTPGTAANLPPSVLITSPTNGQVFTSATIPITVEVAPGSGTVSSVTFYDVATPVGTNTSSPFSFTWPNVPNGSHNLSAVAVNNSGLSRTSAVVSVTVASGFAIATPPLSQTVGVGQTAKFHVKTTGTNVTYQWQFNGSNLFGATHSSYTISNAPTSASGIYTVVVTSRGQSITSAPAMLTVLGPPTLGSPSLATNNGNITLSLNVSDSVPFYSQWQLNGNGIAGATNNSPAGTNIPISFTISNARPFDSGNYQVVVANAVASEESPSFNVALSVGTPVTTNNNFNSSLNFDPLTTNGVAGINNSSASFPPVDGPALIAGKPASGFLWYNWTANFTGVISLTTRGSSFDTLMGVYTGSTLSSLKSVTEDDDSGGFFTSLVTFNCVQGTTYQIAVAGYQGATGNTILQLSPGPPDFPGPAGGYQIGVTDPVITQDPLSQIVPPGATVTLSGTASNAISYQWFFANAPVAGGTANTLVISNFPATAAGQYYLQVSNAVGAVFSSIAGVQIASGNPTTNLLVDKFGDAADLTGAIVPDHFIRPEDDTGGFNLSQTFSTVGATKEVGEPNHAGQPGGASYWYTFNATGNGTIQFDTTGSAFNTILAIYKNKNAGATADFSSLTNIGSDYTTNYVQQGQPVVTISNVVSNTKFYIAIDGYQGASGDARLNVTLTPPPPPTNAVAVTNTQTVVAFTSPVNNSLAAGSNITVRGTIKGSGGKAPALTSLQVIVNNNAPVTLSNFTAIAGGTLDWILTNVLLQPGPNVFTAQSINVESASQETASLPATCTVFYDATAPSPSITSHLTLLSVGSGTIKGETDGASLEVGKVYKVKAMPTGNWVFDSWASGTNTNSLSLLSDSANLSFDMSSNLILQATFVTNPFTAVAGTYNGLFAPVDGVTEESSGFLTVTLPPNGRGAYSAKLLLDGGSNSFSGAFDLTGAAQATVTHPGKPPLAVTLQINLTAPDGQLTGSVNNYETNGWTSVLQGYRAALSAKSSRTTNYTLIIPPGSGAPASQPGGYGYLTLANKAGDISLSGHLADGAPLSQSVAVSAGGAIPLYVSLYAGKGSLQGWLTLADLPPPTVLGAGLSWIKLPGKTGTPYAAGFTNTEITVIGSLYVPPAEHANAITLSNATLTISNGAVNATYTNVSVKGDDLINNGTNIGTIAPATGLLTVKLPHGDGGEAKGVILQDSAPTNAAGWFLDTDQSGFFLLQN